MSVPVLSVAQMREWEQATWATGQTEAEVIRRVGQLVARRALQLTHPGETILILAGKGHNGDDARLAQEHLAGREVPLLNVTDPAAALVELKSLLKHRPALIVDALFGIGLNRPLDEHWIKLIDFVNAAGAPILAVDVPSGLDADTGEVFGGAIQASITLTLGAPKRGLLVQQAWSVVGRLEVAPDIGLVACPHMSELNWTLPDDFTGYPPPRPAAGHKGTCGHLVIIAGSRGFHGAAVLAARGAQRAQPGLITLLTSETVYQPVAAQLQAVMVSTWQPEPRLPATASAILFGPGLAAAEVPDELKITLRRLWKDSPLPMVVDASALDWLPVNSTVPKNAVRVITPHPGEAARLLKADSKQVQSNRPNTLREISKRFGDCWVVLKGHQSLVGRSAGEIFINSSGNPYLAQGGSGDVLAGYLGGLIAQPALQSDALKTIRYGVWQHGVSADRLSDEHSAWTVEDLVEQLSRNIHGSA
ncbi:MAG: NAD(P)H-hydrate dehydratase [Verrucomicrobia bacterium]|nr:NAD(P)H-hydrate dehydratase [Verrucomicrobiota bacterium]